MLRLTLTTKSWIIIMPPETKAKKAKAEMTLRGSMRLVLERRRTRNQEKQKIDEANRYTTALLLGEATFRLANNGVCNIFHLH